MNAVLQALLALPSFAADLASPALAAAAAAASRNRCHAPGSLHNTNTLEGFRGADRAALLRAAAEQIWADIQSGAAEDRPSLLLRFLLLSFADLKKWCFYYWFAFPALALPTPAVAAGPPVPASQAFSPDEAATVAVACEEWRSGGADAAVPCSSDLLEEPSSSLQTPGTEPAFLLHISPGRSVAAKPLRAWESLRAEAGQVLLVFYDPCNLPANPGWPLRNILVLAAARWHLSTLRVMCYRERKGRISLEHCPIFTIRIAAPTGWGLGQPCPDAVGWSRNERGKSGPSFMDLAHQMDPIRLATEAADLNLKLMKWRLLPSLQVERLAATRCLLIGAGTLGCQVARGLLAWGVRKITLVDYGKVSMSNPLRQSLFTLEDCLNGGRPKAEAAADSLRKIFPGAEARGVQLAIPMPGHPVREQDAAGVANDCKRLVELVKDADIVFLLTDTRESRWLPTLLCAASNKVALTAALGFDTYLVMRHGPGPGKAYGATLEGSTLSTQKGPAPEVAQQEAGSQRLGCYFCNDVVAPQDSMANRTLDQQCTVTRPGLAPIAGALVVEFAIGILHHPLGIHAPADMALAVTASTELPLGILPHQIRGFLSHFAQLVVKGHAFDKCTACSRHVVAEYLKYKEEFLLQVFNHPMYLEDLTGLTALMKATQNVSITWDEDDEEVYIEGLDQVVEV
eukprot:SM000010S04302  [mRNA]  locus=s10:828104:832287:+ [translate_table: standard]